MQPLRPVVVEAAPQMTPHAYDWSVQLRGTRSRQLLQGDAERIVGHSVPRTGSGQGSLVDVELLAQGQVLESEPAVAAEEEREESKQVEQEASAGRVGMLRFSSSPHSVWA